MKAKALLVGLLLLTAGCLGMDDTGENETNLSDDNATDSGENASASPPGENQSDEPDAGSNETSQDENATLERSVNLTANITNGTVPLPVSFSINVTGLGANESANWTLAFGDGNQTNGTNPDLLTTVNHTYQTAGNLTAIFNVTYEDGEIRQDTWNLTIGPGNQTAAGWPSETYEGTFTMTFAGVGPAGGASGLSGDTQLSWSYPPGTRIAYLNLSVSFQTGFPGQEITFDWGTDCSETTGGTLECENSETTADTLNLTIENPEATDWQGQFTGTCTTPCQDDVDWTLTNTYAPPS